MKHILVTGATGFIGSHLIKKLGTEKQQVTAIIRTEKQQTTWCKEEYPTLSFFVWNHSVSALASYMKETQVDCVVHLATKYITQNTAEDIEDLVDGNITFGLHILEAMKLAGVQNIITTSTSWQHYQNKEYSPVNLYAATKQGFEDILKYYTDAENLHALTLEIYDTYGPNDKRNKIFNLWKNAWKTKENIALSPGEQRLNCIYIEDILSGLQRAMQILEEHSRIKGGYEAKYALNSDEIYTLKELAEIFEKIYQTTLPISWGGKTYRKREVMIPYQKLKRLPGWNARYSLPMGLKQMRKEEEGEASW